MPRPDYTLPLDQLPDPLPIEPLTQPFDVTITPPGSKSITCRAYVLAALAQGESKLIRPLRADDTDLLLEALCTLGAEARWEGEDVFIKGVNGRFPRGGSVNLGDGGTPTRFMIACACLAAEPVVVDGSKRMRERPIAEGVEMLRQLGANIEYVEAEGRLPVRVTPSKEFVGGEIEVGHTQSSQSLSALLLLAPWLPRGTSLQFREDATSAEYLDLTWSVLSDWNLLNDDDVLDSELESRWKAGSRTRVSTYADPFHEQPNGNTYRVEPDASSAVYWFAAAALNRDARVIVEHLDRFSPQPDQSLIGMFQSSGALVTTRDLGDGRSVEEVLAEPWRTIVQGKGVWLAQDFHGEGCPDGSVLLAACAALADGRMRITGLRTLRVKETDRIAALANELRKVGCTVATGDDWIEITPPPARNAGADDRREEAPDQKSPGARSGPSSVATATSSDPAYTVIETYNDHRMAMAFAVLGLAAPSGRRLAIRNPACVAKSYPTFWRDFDTLYQ